MRNGGEKGIRSRTRKAVSRVKGSLNLGSGLYRGGDMADDDIVSRWGALSVAQRRYATLRRYKQSSYLEKLMLTGGEGGRSLKLPINGTSTVLRRSPQVSTTNKHQSCVEGMYEVINSDRNCFRLPNLTR